MPVLALTLLSARRAASLTLPLFCGLFRNPRRRAGAGGKKGRVPDLRALCDSDRRDSGTVLFEKSADKLNPPASMSKLMTVEVVLHTIAEGKLKFEDEMTISENAWRKGGAPSGGSAMFAALNSRVSVRDLLHGVMIQSGNDACITLAEGIAGSELAFADLMNRRAKESA